MVIKVPDCIVLAKDPNTKEAIAELKIMIILLLGIAVQAPNPINNYFIERIVAMPSGVQQTIMAMIQEVCNNRYIIPFVPVSFDCGLN